MSRETVDARLAVIEEQVKAHGKLDDKRFKQMESLDAKLDKIDNELSRYRGFVGGILLIVTALVTFFKIFGSGITDYFSK